MPPGLILGLAAPVLAQTPAATEADTPIVSAAPGGLLPATGAGPNIEDSRDLLGATLGGAALALPPGLVVKKALGLAEIYRRTDGQTSGSDFITSIQPDIGITDRTPSVQAKLYYEPDIRLYTRQSGQDRVNQYANGRLHAMLVPDALFLDLRGAATVEATGGLAGPGNTTVLSRGNTTQTYSLLASPYLLHGFGPWGTGEVGAAYSRTTQNPISRSAAMAAGLPAEFTVGQGLSTTSAHVGFVTGEATGRYTGSDLAIVSNLAGSGVLHGAYRNLVTFDNGYAVDHRLALLGRIGYEDIHYSGTSPLTVSDAVWDAGFRFVLGPKSKIEARYGHHDGFNSPYLVAEIQTSARTLISARYSSALSTQDEQLQNALATSDVDSLGNQIDPSTGAPLLSSGNFVGALNSLYRVSRGSMSASLLLDRDIISLTIVDEQRKLVSSSFAGQAIGSNRSVYGTAAWAHELAPRLTGTIFVEDGTNQRDGTAVRNSRLELVAASLRYQLSPTLAGTIQGSYNHRSGALYGNGRNETVLLVSARKSF